MKSLEKVFQSSYLKGDGSIPNHTPDISGMHASALLAWGLLVSIAPQHIVDDVVDRYVSQIKSSLAKKKNYKIITNELSMKMDKLTQLITNYVKFSIGTSIVKIVKCLENYLLR